MCIRDSPNSRRESVPINSKLPSFSLSEESGSGSSVVGYSPGAGMSSDLAGPSGGEGYFSLRHSHLVFSGWLHFIFCTYL